MKKLTLLMLLLIAGAFATNAQEKEPMRSAIFDNLPSEFTQLGNTSIYYSMIERQAAGPGTIVGVSILGEINDRYYSSTYESNGLLGFIKRAGAGFLAAFQVDGNNAVQVNARTGTTANGVTFNTSLEPQGDVAARIIYTLTNTNDQAVTVNAGVWGDIMIGDNDRAPLERLKNSQDYVYGIKMKYQNTQNTPLLCALFGEGVTGVTPIDDYWFGFYRNNYYPYQIVGSYSTNISNYMQENGNYDCGMGFCWKNRVIEPGETIELSWVISVGEIDYEEPVVPGEDHFTYEVEAYNIDAWNDLGTGHPAHIWGYYEHPYGQNGYIEYQVDGGEWIRIEQPLISGEDYDLEFIMRFDLDNITLHTLNLRFNDGLDNYTELNGLSWTDVRSFNVEGFEDRTYNGEPQIYNVTYDGEIYVVGTEGEYVEPGDYFYQIFGDYDQNTIGIYTVEFTIDKGQTEIIVTLPEDVMYDGEAHGATVQVVVGDGTPIVTYVNVATGEILTEAPVEVGIYDVIVEVPETDYYYGLEADSYGQFQIYRKSTAVEELTINEDNGAWYTIEGIRVNAPSQRGIYIHNGKKYVVK